MSADVTALNAALAVIAKDSASGTLSAAYVSAAVSADRASEQLEVRDDDPLDPTRLQHSEDLAHEGSRAVSLDA